MASPFENMTFLFTGKLKNMKRDDAEARVAALGGKVASGVSKNLSVLVATSETSAKTKAQELNSKGANIQLWTEEQFLEELKKAENARLIPAEKTKTGTTKKLGTTKKMNAAKAESDEVGMRPFIIEIEVKKRNTEVEYTIHTKNKYGDKFEYEVLCSDSKDGKFKSFICDFPPVFKHTFKEAGKYKISFRGNLPGLFLRDKKNYELLDVCQWGDICWLKMDSMFAECRRFNISAVDQPNLSKVKSLVRMFYCAESLNAPLEKWDVSKVTDMSGMFQKASSFNQPLEKWDVRNVKNMNWMFDGASSFNQPLEKWNVSKVTEMCSLFADASSFNQPLEKWEVTNVNNMKSMFAGASSFNQPLENWDVSNVTNMSLMFIDASSFNQPLEKWDVSNVTDMSFMFSGASSFNQPLEKWNVSKVTSMSFMFKCAEAMKKQPSWIKE